MSVKYNGNYTRQISITQHLGGYLITELQLGSPEPIIVQSFEELCNVLAGRFGLKDIGERVVISATYELQENDSICKGKS